MCVSPAGVAVPVFSGVPSDRAVLPALASRRLKDGVAWLKKSLIAAAQSNAVPLILSRTQVGMIRLLVC